MRSFSPSCSGRDGGRKPSGILPRLTRGDSRQSLDGTRTMFIPGMNPALGNFFLKNLASSGRLGFFAPASATHDPFVYRLGLQVFILARRVRLPYGSPI